MREGEFDIIQRYLLPLSVRLAKMSFFRSVMIVPLPN